MILLKVLCVLFLTVSAQDQCRTANGDAGTCLLLDSCEPLLSISKKTQKSSDDIMYLRQSSCGLFMNKKPKVCCPPESQWSRFSPSSPLMFPTGAVKEPINRIGATSLTTAGTSTSPPSPTPDPSASSTTTLDPFLEEFLANLPGTITCGPTLKPPKPESFCCGLEASISEKIIGGEAAAIDQYPWMVLFEYSDTKRLPCSGTLISSRYVLTAAHCLEDHKWGSPVRARLAEYNTSTFPVDEVQTQGGGVETIRNIVIDIERQISHPGYSRFSKEYKDDIGLVKLSRDAPYTDFIRPICLPNYDINTKPSGDEIRLLTAGWGSNGEVFTEVKQHINLPYVSLANCQPSYVGRLSNVKLLETHVCAGGEKDRDTCGGDSGGPLMYANGDVVDLVGIVSFGSHKCGQEGKPGVYTNVYKFINWILEEMT